MDVKQLLQHLKSLPTYRGQVVHTAEAKPRPARYARLSAPLPAPLEQALKAAGIKQYYTHQAAAIDAARSGRFAAVVTATSTSSGKTLAYNVPVLAAALERRQTIDDRRQKKKRWSVVHRPSS